MTPALHLNRDYLIFVESGVLFTLATASWALAKIEHGRAWRWFGHFALAQTVQAWIEIVMVDTEAGAVLPFVARAVRAAGIFALFGFAWNCGRQDRSSSRARMIPLVLGVVLAIAGVVPDTIVRGRGEEILSLLGWPIALGAAVNCLRLSERGENHAARRLRLLSLLLPPYCLVALLPADSFVTEGMETTLQLPMQAVRGLLALLVGLVVYGHNAIQQQRLMPSADARSWRRRRIAFATVLWAIVMGGGFVIEAAGDKQDAAMRQQILVRSQLAAASVDVALVRQLRWDGTDLASPSYQRLKQLMISLRAANEDLRFAMLTGLRGDRTFFLVDSEPPESKDYSPPGQLYEEASPDYHAAFARRQPFVLGPLVDRWGTWVVCAVPLLELEAGRGVNFEVNIAAANWEARVRATRLPVVLITLLICLLLVVSFQMHERIRESSVRIGHSERRAKSLVEGSPDCVQMFDLAGRYVAVNRNGLAALGWSESAVIGRRFVDLWPAAAQPAIQAAVNASLEGRPTSFESDYLRPDGRGITWRVATNPIYDEKGKVCSFVAICVDLTERKITERALVVAKEVAEKATHAKSEFLAVMGHELRTPLGGVIGMLELLQQDPAPPLRRRYLGVARDTASMLLRILDDILDTAKIEAGKLSLETIPFRPREEFLSLSEAAACRAEAQGLGFHFAISPSVPAALLGDPTRLRQVLSNLQNNALKFTERGSVHVEISAVPLEGGRVRLTFVVRDTGVGIPEEARQRLFAKFEQADASTTRRFGGTGLGLSIVKTLAECMGGEITVESVVGVGSTFVFSAPLAVAETHSLPVATPLPGAMERSSAPLRILCAEDDATNQLIAEAMVRGLGHRIVFADNGRLAIERLQAETFDVVLMDHRMPVLDGLQTTRMIRAREAGAVDPEIHIIAVTANASPDERELCLREGMDDFLTKPLQRPALCAALERAIVRLRSRGRLPTPASSAGAADAVPDATPNEAPVGLSEADLLASLDAQTADERPRGRDQFDAANTEFLFRTFTASTPERFATMRRALHQGDANAFGCAAHALASSSGYVEARLLGHLAAAMELLADADRAAVAAPLLELAEDEFNRRFCADSPLK